MVPFLIVSMDEGFVYGLSFQVVLHEVIIEEGELFEELLPIFLGRLSGPPAGWISPEDGAEGLLVPDDSLHGDQIDDTVEAVLSAQGYLERYRVGPELFGHHIDDAKKIGAEPVELVDEGDPRHVVLVCLVPDGLRLGLNAFDARKRPRPCRRGPGGISPPLW